MLNMTFKDEIERLKMDAIVLRFPQHNREWCVKMWYNTIKYTKGKTAAQIEKNIISYIKTKGHHAEKHSVTGREITGKDVHTAMGVLKGKKTFIPSQSQIGSADITSTIYGISVKIEVKKGKDVQSDKQKEYQKQIETVGGFYFIAHNEDDFYVKFNELLQHPKIILMKSYEENN